MDQARWGAGATPPTRVGSSFPHVRRNVDPTWPSGPGPPPAGRPPPRLAEGPRDREVHSVLLGVLPPPPVAERRGFTRAGRALPRPALLFPPSSRRTLTIPVAAALLALAPLQSVSLSTATPTTGPPVFSPLLLG